MFEPNTIADLQMRMNAGDGRQAVLAELLRLEGKWRYDQAAVFTAGQKAHGRPPIVDSDHGGPKIHVIDGRRKHPPQQLFAIKPDEAEILAEITAILDQLSLTDKEVLLNFMEALAHAFNNLFMTIVGHLSIVMYHLEPSDPLCRLFRSSEDQIHNTAMMIRLMVDVFQSPQTKTKMLHLVHLGQREIDKREFGDALSATRRMIQGSFKPLEQEVLKIMLGCIAQYLQRMIHTLQRDLTKAFQMGRHRKSEHHFRQIRLQIKKGKIMCGALKDFAQKFSFNRSALVHQQTSPSQARNRQTPLKIKCLTNYLPHPVPANIKETVCIGNVCMSVEQRTD